ncbi:MULTISPECIES: DUF4260 domain-containing protein [Salegentibacter]|jgi:hypothetical protein|uniref:DUF4260 domain-containing protein n=1 Tax=Salegentibacter agarivorans TaxID=345907 RepID=A0A1I2LBY8_9FLAO|nr:MULTISPECIES: DUF4260 domain-containing protein [Salegentibacter]APS38773.1 hypothetical protein AO058_07740 [Salegentibacter sp. T436]SFF74596.1 protein of unknown function [Salegentibacter agarivorans]
MKITLALEELGMLILGIFAFSRLDFAWWWFLVLFFTPDFGMLGYLFNNKIGALIYNLFHHKGFAISIWFLGFYLQNEVFQLIGVILFSHAAFDRILGYGLKYEKGFKFTHLGEIGN